MVENIDIKDIEELLTLDYSNGTDEYKAQKIIAWSQKIIQWLIEARALVAQNSSVAEKLTQTAQNLLSKQNQKSIETTLINAYKMRKLSKNQLINTERLIVRGYTLLNIIGESIRGEQILYSLTINVDGTAISQGVAGKVYTIQVPLSQFLKFVKIQDSTRLVLHSSSAINSIIQAMDSENKPIQEIWTQEKINNFAIFAAQGRGVEKRWKKVNEGNLLEAFFRFMQDGNTVGYYSYDQSYWGKIGHAMKMTMKNPDPFWVGGDINNIQVKGLKASITNLGTIISAFSQLLQILQQDARVYEALKPQIKSKFSPQIQDIASNSIEQTSKALIDFFTSKVNRN